MCYNKGYGSVYTVEVGESWTFSQAFLKRAFNQSYCWFFLSPGVPHAQTSSLALLSSDFTQSYSLSTIYTLTTTIYTSLSPRVRTGFFKSLLSPFRRHFTLNSSSLAPSPRLTFFFSSLNLSSCQDLFSQLPGLKTLESFSTPLFLSHATSNPPTNPVIPIFIVCTKSVHLSLSQRYHTPPSHHHVLPGLIILSGLPTSAFAPASPCSLFLMQQPKWSLKKKKNVSFCHLSKKFPSSSERNPKTLTWPWSPSPLRLHQSLSGSFWLSSPGPLGHSQTNEAPNSLRILALTVPAVWRDFHVPGTQPHLLRVSSQRSLTSEVILDTLWYGQRRMCISLCVYV